VKEIIEGQVIEVEEGVNTGEFLYPWEEYKDDFFDDFEYLEARRDFAAMRATKHLWHSSEIEWDPRDHRQPQHPLPTDWRSVAKAIIFLAFILGVAAWVAW
jgi:hypothetical protein